MTPPLRPHLPTSALRRPVLGLAIAVALSSAALSSTWAAGSPKAPVAPAAASAAKHTPLATMDDTPPDPTVDPNVSWKLPRYLLQAPNGRAVTANDFPGRFQLIAFGFVSCPDVCPTTMLEMQQILQSLGDAKAKQLQPIFISVDPARDTLEVLGAYTRSIDPRILGLTGRPDLVKFAADQFGVSYTKVQEPGAPANVYTMDHTAGLFLLGPEGQLLARFGYSTPVPRMVERIRSWMDRSNEIEQQRTQPPPARKP